MSDIVHKIAAIVSTGATGELFLQELVMQLAEILETEYVFIGELLPANSDRIKTVAVFVDGHITSNFEYDLADTPCADVICQTVCSYSSGVQQLYPHDTLLAQVGAEGYIGVPIFDAHGQALALIAVVSRKPISNCALAESILRIVATRVTAELERIHKDETLKVSQERLSAVIDHTPVILWATNAVGVITLSVGKGLSALGLHQDELVGQSVFELYQDAPEILQRHRRALAGEQFSTTGDVGDATLETQWNPVFDESGNVIAVTGISTDITERKRANQRLQLSEDRFRSLVQRSGDIISLLEADGKVLYVSPAITPILGFETDQLNGKHIFDYVHPDDRQRLEEAFLSVTDQDSISIYDFRFCHANGEWMWLESAVTDLRNDPSVGAIVAYSRDITKRKQAENALALSIRENIRLAAAIANLQTGVVVTDPHLPDNPIIFANPAVCRLTGYSVTEILGRNCRFLQGPQTDSATIQAIREAITSRRPFAGQLLNYRKDGSPFYNGLLISPVFDADGQLINFIGTLDDVTDRVQMEQALRESEERFQAFMDNSPTLAFIKDEEGQYVYFNKATERRFKTSLADLKGKTNFDRMPLQVAQQLRQNDLQVLASGQPLEVVESIPTPDDRATNWLTFKFPLQDAAGQRLIGGVAIDISERVRAEDALRASEREMSALFDNALDGILLANDEGRYVKVNPAACQLFGYSSEDFLQMSVWDITPAHNKARGIEMWNDFIKAGQLSGELQVARRDQSTLEVEFHATANILPGLHLTMLRDTTERVQYEESLKRSRMQLEEAQRLAHLGSWDWDLTTGTLRWSDEHLRIFGITTEEFGGTLPAALDCVHPDDRELITAAVEQTLNSKMPFEIYYRIIRGDGSTRTIYARGAVSVNDAGEAVRLFGTAQDITERKQIEEALQESESRFRRLTEANIIGIIISDLQGRVLEANAILLNLVGYSPAELESGAVRWDQMTPAKHRQHTRRAISQLKKTGAAVPWEQEFICKNGNLIPVLMGATLLEGSQEHFIAFVVELSAQKAAEASLRETSQELLNSREQLRALAAHLDSLQEEARARIAREIHDELGQALTGLKMDLSWLMRRLPAAGLATDSTIQTAEWTRHISEMSQLIDTTIQAVRRLCSELRPRILDDLGLEAAAEWQVQEFQKRSGIRCRLVSSIGALPLERETSIAVFRILQEALTNTARHAAASRVTVTLKAETHHLVMQVKDNGCGFDTDILESKKTLGLMGIHERALILGGKVAITSAAKKGTTLALSIPLLHHPS